MKKRILPLVLSVVLLAVIAEFLYEKNREDDAALQHCAWWSVQEPYSIRIMFLEDDDGILPIDKPTFLMSVYDWGTGAEPLLDGYELWEGSWTYDGTWSLKNDILTLKIDHGDTVLCTVEGDTILLDVGEGYLLKKYTGEE